MSLKDQLEKAAERLEAENTPDAGETKTKKVIIWDEKTEALYAKAAVQFAEEVLRFKPLPYQVKLLEDKEKRIVVIWPRQSGKTTTLSVRMIWYAATHPRTTSLIVAPGSDKA